VGAPVDDTDSGPVVPGDVHAMQEQGRRGGVRARGPATGPAWDEQCEFWFIQTFLNEFELILSKGGLPLIQKIQIKYEIVENEIRNNFSYWDFSKFETEFELKFKEALGIEFQWNLIEFDWDFQELMQSELGAPDCTWMTNQLMRKSLKFQDLWFLYFPLKI
jgi:hypothetical protein